LGVVMISIAAAFGYGQMPRQVQAKVNKCQLQSVTEMHKSQVELLSDLTPTSMHPLSTIDK